MDQHGSTWEGLGLTKAGTRIAIGAWSKMPRWCISVVIFKDLGGEVVGGESMVVHKGEKIGNQEFCHCLLFLKRQMTAALADNTTIGVPQSDCCCPSTRPLILCMAGILKRAPNKKAEKFAFDNRIHWRDRKFCMTESHNKNSPWWRWLTFKDDKDTQPTHVFIKQTAVVRITILEIWKVSLSLNPTGCETSHTLWESPLPMPAKQEQGKLSLLPCKIRMDRVAWQRVCWTRFQNDAQTWLRHQMQICCYKKSTSHVTSTSQQATLATWARTWQRHPWQRKLQATSGTRKQERMCTHWWPLLFLLHPLTHKWV